MLTNGRADGRVNKALLFAFFAPGPWKVANDVAFFVLSGPRFMSLGSNNLFSEIWETRCCHKKRLLLLKSTPPKGTKLEKHGRVIWQESTWFLIDKTQCFRELQSDLPSFSSSILSCAFFFFPCCYYYSYEARSKTNATRRITFDSADIES